MSDSILIWSDMHNRVDLLAKFLERNGSLYSKRYFQGDYFDQFYDTPADALKTARMVKDLLDDPRNRLCIGNHDIPYMFPTVESLWCPGFSKEKSDAINSVLKKEDWDKMQLAYFVNGWLISHAGFNHCYVSHPVNGITVEGIMGMCMFDRQLVYSTKIPLLMPGRDRGFDSPYLAGGVLWQDWGMFAPINGINQIVGHTPNDFPRIRVIKPGYMSSISYNMLPSTNNGKEVTNDYKSINWCIDTNNQHFGVIEGNRFIVYDTRDFL